MTISTARVRRQLENVRIVHHLPGRMRLRVPGLERLSPKWNQYCADAVGILKLKEGIDDVQVSIATGRVLVAYNPRLTNPSEIINWLRRVVIWVVKGYSENPFRSLGQVVPFLVKMQTRIHRLLISENRENEVIAP